MILDEQVIKYSELDAWFKIPQGARIARAFSSELKDPADIMRGRRLVQLGFCGDSPWLSMLNYSQKWIATPVATSEKSAFTTSMLSLPIERSSVDCVIAPLTFNVFTADKNPLNEIDRILKPMGYIIFFGINPWSFWGLAAQCGRIPCFKKTSSTMSSSLTLKKNMLMRGYSQCMLNSFYYIPPVTNQRLIHHLEFFNEMGKMIWPFPAGFYCLIVQKYQPATPAFIFNRHDDPFLYVARN